MVYCGKPSRGCQMCRTRRIKCDETKPTCTQCQKSRRQCPGYKDDFDLVFRNETQATERRARKSTNSKKLTSQATQRDQQRTFSISSEAQNTTQDMSDVREKAIAPLAASATSVTVTNGFEVPVEQQALCFFLANFVYTPQQTSARGYMDFLIPMMKTESPDSHLSVAFQAVAMASLANRPNSRGSGLMTQAIAQYAKALKVTNLALQNPALQKTDQTLASIILLGFFETITLEKTNVMAWGSHIDGAVQLVRMRGKKQLRTRVGTALFIAVRTQMIINCMSASKAPMLGTEWWIAEAIKDETSQFVTKLNLRVAELRAELNQILATSPRNQENFEKVLALMRRAQGMEQDYLAWEDQLPDLWRVRTVAWIDNVPDGDLYKADVCPGKVDMYDDIFIASVWNMARVSRLFISGIIIRCAAWVCAPVDYRTTPEYATAARLGVDMISDIVASIPYHLGWRTDEYGHLTPGDLSGFACGTDNITSPKALGGFFCIWPLFSTSCSDFTTDSQRKWIKGRLLFISETMGMNQAKTIGSFQLRLPSMIVKRDSMGHAYPDPRAYLATKGMHPVTSPVATQSQQSLQQREATMREAWERDRKTLLKKASNSQGESSERILANYLAI
ncbi:negative acting factor [Phlyctema vagabunda]|uniref:Negative acting factor n=1 Tax=Phlyctema vagabunda TaxID=108571 RepID=A0ABR4PS86_9HELO